MPKILFYGGLACCILGALLASSEAVALLLGRRFGAALVLNPAGPITSGVVFALGIFLVAVPVFSIFVRMGSLLAARNLFAAFFSLISSASATLSLIIVAVVQLRSAVLRTTAGSLSAIETLAELNLSAFYMFGWFLSLALLALRPYFMVQSSRFLSWMVCAPLPAFIVYVGQQVLQVGPPLGAQFFAAVYFVAVAILLIAIPVHSLRHRYLFLEATNLRELLDPRIDPAVKGAFRIRGDVAFDS